MRRGFSLLEVLVALALLGLLAAALLTFTQGVLAANQAARAQAELNETLKDAVGYLADTLQGASDLKASETLLVNQNSCSTPSCLVAVFPGSPDCPVRAYRLVDRTALPPGFKDPDPWADRNTRVLLEYRGTAACTASEFTLDGPYLVLDRVDVYTTPPFFSLATSPLRVSVALRLKTQAAGRTVYAPRSGTYSFTVYPRNAP